MSLCVVGAKTLVLAASAFTLSWTHSVQKTVWEEDWRVEQGGLRIVAARVEGSGAGMEAGEGATFDGRFWRWKPTCRCCRKCSCAGRTPCRRGGSSAPTACAGRWRTGTRRPIS